MTGESPRSIARRITETLTECRSGDLIRHPRTGETPPRDQYALSCFAVAALRAGARYGRDDLHEEGTDALRSFLDREPASRGHGEFNTFALLEIVGDQRAGMYGTGIPESELLDQTTFDASPVSNQGNNWLLLQALCRLRRADFTGHALDDLRARRQLRMARRWQLDDGVFADQPRYPLAPAETPLTYHAKMTYLAARIGEYHPAWYRIALNGLRALYCASLPSGESLYFGRSENTVFGYACILAAIDGYAASGNDVPGWLPTYRERVETFLAGAFDPTDLDSLPAGEEQAAIDEYVYDVVYGAYAAMLLLDLQNIDAGTSHRGAEDRSPCLPASGLLASEGDETAIALATDGQMKLREGRPDVRYAGMVPHAISDGDDPIHPGMPIEYYRGGPPPFLPTVRTGAGRFLPATWEVKSRRLGDVVEVTGVGEYHSLPDARKGGDKGATGGSPVRDLLAAVANRTRTRTLYERWKKRPADIDVRTERTVRYDTKRDVLSLATTTRSDGAGATIRPSSGLVTPEYTDAVECRTHPRTEWSTDEVRGHRGPGVQVVGEPLDADEVRCALVFDPRGNVDTVEADGGGTWTVEFRDGTATVIGSRRAVR